MLLKPYQLDELTFAWCYRVSYRWRTHRADSTPALAKLDKPALSELMQPYGIHILEASADSTDVVLLASLVPQESVSACAGKTKGQVSKWLREQMQLAEPQKLFSRSYFACTAGKSTAEAVDEYLTRQSAHHGYDGRINPPIFVQKYQLSAADEARLSPRHAVAVLRFHIVLATTSRRGVFGQAEGQAVADRWRKLEAEHEFALEKVSFLPDHVHLAVLVHPGVAPANLVVALMNAAQEVMWEDFDRAVIQAGIERLWQPSAYIGAYGDVQSGPIAAYIRNWSERGD